MIVRWQRRKFFQLRLEGCHSVVRVGGGCQVHQLLDLLLNLLLVEDGDREAANGVVLEPGLGIPSCIDEGTQMSELEPVESVHDVFQLLPWGTGSMEVNSEHSRGVRLLERNLLNHQTDVSSGRHVHELDVGVVVRETADLDVVDLAGITEILSGETDYRSFHPFDESVPDFVELDPYSSPFLAGSCVALTYTFGEDLLTSGAGAFLGRIPNIQFTCSSKILDQDLTWDVLREAHCNQPLTPLY